MKAVATAVIIFVSVSCFCLYTEIYTSDGVKKMNSEIERIKIFMNSEKEKEAAECFFKLKNDWEHYEKYFQLMTEHEELDKINEQMAVLTSVFENKDYAHFRESSYTLSFYLKHISEKKKINLVTIL